MEEMSYLLFSRELLFLFSVSTTLGICHLSDNCHDSWFEVISHYESLLSNLFLFIRILTCLVSV